MEPVYEIVLQNGVSKPCRPMYVQAENLPKGTRRPADTSNNVLRGSGPRELERASTDNEGAARATLDVVLPVVTVVGTAGAGCNSPVALIDLGRGSEHRRRGDEGSENGLVGEHVDGWVGWLVECGSVQSRPAVS